jgi:type I restriction enzyme S subunit
MAKPEIRLKGFEGEWKPDIIGNIANVVGGGTPSTSITNYWNGGIQWFTPSEVGKSRYVSCSERNISKEGLDNSSAKIIPANSILLSSRATVGEASINTCKCCTNQGFQSLIPKNVDLDFLYTLIATIKRDIVRESSGSTFLEISANKVRNLSVTIPNLIEQKALGVYFKSLDSMIQGVTKKIASLKQMKQACLVSMFPQGGETTPRVRFKGFKGEWEIVKLSSIATRVTRKNSHLESTLPLTISAAEGLIEQTAFFNNVVASSNVSGYYLVKRGEFAYNKSYSNGYPFGTVKRLDRYDMGVLSTLYIVFSVSETICSDYIVHFFDTSLWHQEVAKRAAEGARNHGLLNIGAEDFLDINIIVPKSKEEQQKIASFFSSLDSQISLQEQRLEKLKQIKSSCLDKMFV